MAVDQVVVAEPRGVGSMKCIKCHSIEMQSTTSFEKGVELDTCPMCKGMWLDKGELESLLDEDATHFLDIPETATQAQQRNCPKCNVKLFQFFYPGTTVMVDSCQQCHGVWLDDEEFTVINIVKRAGRPGYPTQSHKPKTSSYTSYADSIPGVKGKVLASIDRAINALQKALNH